MAKVDVMIGEAGQGVSLPTGQFHRVVIHRADVLLEIEWDDAVAADFDGSAELALTVEGATQRRPLAEAMRKDGRVGVAFRWNGRGSPTTMRVKVNGGADPEGVVVWRDRAIEAEHQVARLAALVAPAMSKSAGGEADGGGADEEEILATTEPGPESEELA